MVSSLFRRLSFELMKIKNLVYSSKMPNFLYFGLTVLASKLGISLHQNTYSYQSPSSKEKKLIALHL